MTKVSKMPIVAEPPPWITPATVLETVVGDPPGVELGTDPDTVYPTVFANEVAVETVRPSVVAMVLVGG